MPFRFDIIIGLLFLVVLPLSSFANLQDSLLHIYRTHPEDSVRLRALHDIAWSYINIDPVLMEKWANRYLKEGKALDIGYTQAVGYNLLGISTSISGDKHKAVEYFKQSLQLCKKYGPASLEITLNNNIGVAYLGMNKYYKAYEYHENAYKAAVAVKDTLKQIFTISNMAGDLNMVGQYEEVFVLLDKHKTLLDLLPADHPKKAYYLGSHHMIKSYAYYKSGRVGQAKREVALTIDIMEKSQQYYPMLEALLLKSDVAIDKGGFATAEASYLKGITIAETYHLSGEKFRFYDALAQLYLKQKKYGQAERYAELAFDHAQGGGRLETQCNALAVILEVQASRQDYQAAFETNLRLTALSDSLAIQQKATDIENLSYQHDLAKREAENQLLISKKNIIESQLRQRNYIFLVVLCLLIMASVATVLFAKAKRRKAMQNLLLEKKVEKRSAELQVLNTRLSQTSNELEKFAYITSHDLKEPLRNINGFVKLIQRRAGDKFEESVAENFKDIIDNVNQMKELIDDVLSFSTASGENIPIECIDLNNTVKNIKKQLDNLIETRGAVINSKQLPVIFSGKPQLHIVLKNLIENGIKYNKSEAPEIHIGYKKVKGAHQISVKDNGIGIDEAYHQQIFDMFKRLHNRSSYKGSGLGLAICKKVVRQLDGDILLESEVGHGATFTIVLPIFNESQSKQEGAHLKNAVLSVS